MPIQTFSRPIDPYKNFKFRVFMGTEEVAAVTKVSALKYTTEVITNRDGGMISAVVNSPGQTKSEPITLDRGLTANRTFEDWASQVFSPLGDGGTNLASMRRNLQIKLLNLQGNVVMQWNVYGCWVSEYTALPELDANANAFAFETIVLQNTGFERDTQFAGEDPAVFQPAG